jgi:hypothetical protein
LVEPSAISCCATDTICLFLPNIRGQQAKLETRKYYSTPARFAEEALQQYAMLVGTGTGAHLLVATTRYLAP